LKSEEEEPGYKEHITNVEHWTVEKSEVDQESIHQWRRMRMKNVGNLVGK